MKKLTIYKTKGPFKKHNKFYLNTWCTTVHRLPVCLSVYQRDLLNQSETLSHHLKRLKYHQLQQKSSLDDV